MFSKLSTNRTEARSGTNLNMSRATLRFAAGSSMDSSISPASVIERTPASVANSGSSMLSLASSMPRITSSCLSSSALTVASYTSVLPACTWLKSICTLPELMNLITPALSSMTTWSPTE